MDYDQIETIGQTTIQHGKFNDRIYVMSLGESDCPSILSQLEALARKHGYSKIFAKIPQSQMDLFLSNGYEKRAEIPHYYGKGEPAIFVSRFLSEERGRAADKDQLEKVISVAQQKGRGFSGTKESEKLLIRLAQPDDIPAMIPLFKKVFETYPFPIFEPDYLRETMQGHVDYYLAFEGDCLVGISSAEKDSKNMAVEMTDFAVEPGLRGKGIGVQLLTAMEKDMDRQGMRILFTIARACSYGMNIVFAKRGYQFSGTLINNTNISGSIESMNIWWRMACGESSCIE